MAIHHEYGKLIARPMSLLCLARHTWRGYKPERVLIPVSDVDRAKSFYVQQCGFTLDVDHQPNDDFRVVQITPPGSTCSLTIGSLTTAEPGSDSGTHLVLTDIEAARADLTSRGQQRNRALARRIHGEIATVLVISPHTVQEHCNTIFDNDLRSEVVASWPLPSPVAAL